MKVRKADDTEFYGVDVWFFFLSCGNCVLKLCVCVCVCVHARVHSLKGSYRCSPSLPSWGCLNPNTEMSHSSCHQFLFRTHRDWL